MPEDPDYLLALKLQNEETDNEVEEVFAKPNKPKAGKVIWEKKQSSEDDLNLTQNLVHPQWEMVDPTPDIFVMFRKFNVRFFNGRLNCVELEWSKRMYSCAGICYSRRSRGHHSCTIRLSEPLLKLRPRKDLVETLLHEMIHAFLFVLDIREGNGGHGPNFKEKMRFINTVAGTNITVYHTFHDEVDLYKQHWWRCDGVCQNRKPYFGYVKRTSNRAPGPNDFWYEDHKRSCGGTFIKVKSPEKKKKSVGAKKKEDTVKKPEKPGNLRKFLVPKTQSPSANGLNSNVKGFGSIKRDSKDSVKPNGGGTMLLNPKTISKPATNTTEKRPSPNAIKKPLPTAAKGNLGNVIGFKDIGGLGGSGSPGAGNNRSPNKNSKRSSDDWGRGNFLVSSGSARAGHLSSSDDSPSGADLDRLREIRAKRFGSIGTIFDNKRPGKGKQGGDTKRRRVSTENPPTKESGSKNSENNKTESDKWHAVDEEIMLKDYKEPVITLSSDDEDEDSKDTDDKKRLKINKDMTIDERQSMIKQEIIDESIDLTDEDIELIDDEYDDTIATSNGETSSTSLRDNDFCSDLMADYKKENDCRPSSSHHQSHPDDDIITCFICLEKMPRRAFGDHIDGCTGITNRILPPKSAMKKLSAISKEARPKKSARPSTQTTRDILRKAGYTDADLARIASADETDGDEDFLSDSGAGRGNRLSASATSVQDLNSSSEDENTRRYRQRNLYKTTRECPVCKADVEESEMNDHLDECLSK